MMKLGVKEYTVDHLTHVIFGLDWRWVGRGVPQNITVGVRTGFANLFSTEVVLPKVT